MQTIRREDKMIASSLHPDIASRAPAPSRPRKPIVPLLCGLILFGVVAPPAADMAFATPAAGTKGGNDRCGQGMAALFQLPKSDAVHATAYLYGVLCLDEEAGQKLTEAERRFLKDVEAGK
jgi:hypothetical protein